MLNEKEKDMNEEENSQNFEEFGLFHKSSLREIKDPPLPEVAKETYGVKRWMEE
jgi:hypothetical protein